MKKWWYVLPLGFFIALVVLLGRGLTLHPHDLPSPLIGKAAPDFDLTSVENANKRVARSELLGHVSLLSVWASWCAVCREEHPVLVQLARRHEVPIYGLNYRDARADAVAWLRTYGDPYVASAFDPQGLVGINYGVYGVPETYVIDRHGIVRHKHIGPLDWKVLNNEILPLVHRLQREQG
ncbi:MAG TPA: DsbE family thiol:disulfide interchange protein [Gammaproteobacteria bacterium]|nr:DsbE family thiol:disulfide interchange protein [Gammaproteobacteria bacterium]